MRPFGPHAKSQFSHRVPISANRSMCQWNWAQWGFNLQEAGPHSAWDSRSPTGAAVKMLVARATAARSAGTLREIVGSISSRWACPVRAISNSFSSRISNRGSSHVVEASRALPSSNRKPLRRSQKTESAGVERSFRGKICYRVWRSVWRPAPIFSRQWCVTQLLESRSGEKSQV